jgi:hypothetical protein
MMHNDESENELHTAEQLKNAGMLRAGGRLIPSDIKGKTGMLLKRKARLSWRRAVRHD